jgi:hypothetical protein
MRTPLLTIGILALLIGLLWIGQGTGSVRWPQSSFMIDQMMWAWYGAGLGLLGLGLMVLAYRGKS